MLIMEEVRLDHARVRVDVNHASLMLKCWILIVLALIWSSSNLSVFMMMFLVISNDWGESKWATN